MTDSVTSNLKLQPALTEWNNPGLDFALDQPVQNRNLYLLKTWVLICSFICNQHAVALSLFCKRDLNLQIAKNYAKEELLKDPLVSRVLSDAKTWHKPPLIYGANVGGIVKVVVFLTGQREYGQTVVFNEAHTVATENPYFLMTPEMRNLNKGVFLYESFKHGNLVQFLQKLQLISAVPALGSTIISFTELGVSAFRPPPAMLQMLGRHSFLTMFVSSAVFFGLRIIGQPLGMIDYVNHSMNLVAKDFEKPENRVFAFHVPHRRVKGIGKALAKDGFTLLNPEDIQDDSFWKTFF